MSSPTLPPELENIIINLLHDDRQALKACSLVCRDFVATGQKHLFTKIVLHRDPARPIFPSQTARLLQVLDSSPHIAYLVESLDIIDNWADRVPQGEERLRLFLTRTNRSVNWVSRDTHLPCILERTKNLKNISFSSAGRGTAWDTLLPAMQNAIRGVCASQGLTRLVLKNTDGFPLTLFNTCPGLKHLELVGVAIGASYPSENVWTGEKTYLESLRMSGLSRLLDGIANWILGPPCRLDISQLQAFSLHSDGRDEVQFLSWKLMYTGASTLKHLTFDALLPGKTITQNFHEYPLILTPSTQVMTDLHDPNFTRVFDVIDLGQLPSLHSLAIRFRISDDNDLDRRVFLLSHILGKIGKGNILRQVTILCIVVADGPVVHRPEAWNQLDKVLSRPEMACLQEVILQISNDQCEVIDVLKKGLPELQEKKKLSLIVH